VPYEVRHPLNNGPAVPVKKRWIWIPGGTKIGLSVLRGTIAARVPVGALLWKEFYLGTDGRVDLVERRILLKVADRDRDNGWLLNGGWRFYTSHHLPRRADGRNGYEGELEVPLDEAAPYLYRPDRWMPTQAKGAATFVTFTGARGRYPYVFPGKTQCAVCHDGAAGGYGNPEARPVLAFGPHPDNLTTASFRALVKRGWIDGPAALVKRYSDPPSPSSGDPTARLVDVFRNNCLSCHNGSSRAIGRDTAFVLEPGRDYTSEALRARLRRRSAVMGRLGFSVVAPGSPAESELVLRLKGAAGRRRMPPAEGGLPDRDERLIKLASRWVAELGGR
jgi:mono/diheme cytochrome c family protein